MICKRFYVSGHVQGVWYRAHTKEQALQLDLTGWAKNLPDGRVEVLACGAKESLEQLEKWLWQGSPLSKVTQVESQIESLNYTYTGFDVVD